VTDVQTWTYATHPPGDGPWRDEPDKAQWIDEATDLDCLAVRAHHGAWCGYVGIPPGHPWYDVSPYDLNCHAEDMHSELNFGSRCDEGKDIETEAAICHVPAPGRPDDVYWIGFDCAHTWDLVPIYDTMSADGWGKKTLYEALGEGPMHATYKSLAFVMGEVGKLAGYAKAAAG
jgi:hypothetical protein